MTIWLILELCIGSVVDVMDVFKEPLEEVAIAVICREVLAVRAGGVCIVLCVCEMCICLICVRVLVWGVVFSGVFCAVREL